MDKLIADIKRVLEENDPTITVEESIPLVEPKSGRESKSTLDMPVKESYKADFRFQSFQLPPNRPFTSPSS
jgi:hypothetical protein